jgi:hypothetical protein
MHSRLFNLGVAGVRFLHLQIFNEQIAKEGQPRPPVTPEATAAQGSSGSSGGSGQKQKSLTEKQEHARQLLAAKKAEKERRAIEEEKTRELERRELGKKVLSTQEQIREQEMKDIAEERRKQKSDDKRALQRLRDQIQADR